MAGCWLGRCGSNGRSAFPCPEHYGEVFTLLNPEGVYTPAQLARICELNIEGKTRVMRNDPKEQRDGLVLELGHTVGHALELLAQLRHGFAIGIGLCVAARVVLEQLGRARCTDGLPPVHIPEKLLHAALRQLASATRPSLRTLSHEQL